MAKFLDTAIFLALCLIVLLQCGLLWRLHELSAEPTEQPQHVEAAQAPEQSPLL